MAELISEHDSPSAASHGPQASNDYQVVARKYRPQTFADLIGQEHVAKGLQGAIQSNRIGHAYLFTGARGVGKTSAARILSKALNCDSGPGPEPCNTCDACQAITSGQDVDVLEIDGASNNGVDEIRLLRQNVSVRPSRSRFKIYIIDEVHMLSKSAFNALLKTLEEPPEHVKFIFCTTEAEKIPITILSRCQRFDFAGIQAPNIIGVLKKICIQEDVKIDEEALELVARRAAGSMRDSQSLLEQLLALGKKEIHAADVHEMLGTAGTARLKLLVGYLLQRDAAGALAELDGAVAEGVDVGQLVDQVLGYLRDCMAAAIGCPAPSMMYTGTAEFADVQAIAKQWGLETILAVVQILDQALARLRYSTHGRIVVELALVRICKLEDLDQLSNWIGQLASGNVPTAGALNAPAIASRLPVPMLDAKKKAELAVEPPPVTIAPPPVAAPVIVPPVTPLPNRIPVTAIPNTQINDINDLLADDERDDNREPSSSATRSVNISCTPENAAALWQQVANALGGMATDYALCAARQTVPGPGRLIVHFAQKFAFHKSCCEKPETLSHIERHLAAISGQRVKVEFALFEDGPTETAPTQRQPASNRQKLMEKAQHPLIKRATELFNAPAVRLEEAEASS